MPHQWIEGNLPVASKCAICDKTCGSVLRLQDWRCLWCRFTVHATCRPGWRARCPLPPWRVSLVPPTALHAAEGDAFQPARPPHASPLLVFVNSKSGDNQGVKFLRRFKQLLNPAQVFDLTAGGGPAPGLRLFRHLDPFRVLVCSGDGSVGWVLAEIDSLNMHKQCQVAVLPLGTGNDLARVLGWGAACDDDAHLPLLLERYEQASAKMLDRWSIMAFERPLGSGTGGGTSERAARQSAIEEAVNSHLDAITHSAELGVVCSASTESLREIVMEAAGAGSVGSERERAARARLMSLLDALLDAIHSNTGAQVRSNSTSSTIEKGQRDKTEKEEVNQRARLAGNRGAEVRRRADSLRRAVVAALGPPQDTLKVSACESRGSWELLPAPKQFADGSRRSSAASDAGPPAGDSIPDVDEEIARLFPLCIGQQQGKSSEHHTPIETSPYMLGSCNPIASSNMLGLLPNLELVNSNSCTNLLKLRDEGSRDVSEISLFRVPSLIISNTASPSDLEEDFQRGETYESDKMTIIDTDAPYNDDMQFRTDGNDLSPKKRLSGESPMKRNHSPESEKDLSDVLSAMSNEECSLGSGIEEKTDHSEVNIDIEDANERICHIDSPETSDTTCPNSETLHGESMLDDMSSVLGQDLILAMMGKNGDIESTFTDETTLFTSDTTSEIPLDSRNPSLEKYDDRIFNFLQKARKSAKDGTGEEKFGFENKVFNLAATTEPVKYCSLAQFVEGNDIARKSFRKHLRHSKKMEKSENGVNKQAVLNEEVESCDTKPDVIRESCSIISSSVGAESVILNKDNSGLLMTRLKEDFDSDLNALKVESIDYEIGPELKIPDRTRIDFEDKITLKKNSLGIDIGNEDMPEGVMPRTFPRVSVVVEPPSPSGSSTGGGGNGNGVTTIGLAPIWARERRCSDNGPRSMLDVERCSSATRRISCGSLFQPGETDRLSKSASSLWGGSGIAGINKSVESSVGSRRPLPIINPLVRLPAWPHVSGGLVGRCLLANADALCAAVSPLMDPQETLLEGFYERAVMNNYFGIGIDAKISLDFHQKREEHPEKCRSRARNYMWYGVLGSREWLQRTYRHLGQRVQLECDGQRIPLPELQGIVVLNIPSFMGGTNFWGGDAGGPFLPPSFDDRVLEVVAVFGSAQMAASRLINLQRHRIAQCRNVQINILGSEGVPVQVDGEAWLQPPGMIRIMHKNRAQVLCRSRALETSLKTWGEKQQKLCTGLPPSSHLEAATPSDELPPAELAQLLVFIETANTLVKWVKMSSITASGCGGPGTISGGGGLYARACEASSAVDALTPDGRLLPADKLRAHLGSLARILAELCTAAESLGVSGGGPSLQQAIRAARQQLTLVRDQGGLASLQPPDSETEQSRSRRGWLRGAANRRASSSAGLNAASNMACAGGIPVSKWGLTEVGNWLISLQLSEHTDAFAKNDVTGRELITLARRDLRDLGVTKVGHIKRILQGIKELQ